MATRMGDEGTIERNGDSWSPGVAGTTWDEAGNSSAFGSAGQQVSDLCSALAARPTLVVGVVAVLLAAIVGNWLANRFPPRSPTSSLADLARNAGGGKKASQTMQRAGQRLSEAADEARGGGSSVGRITEGVQAGASLVPLGVKLLSNPIVQYYLRRALTRQVARTFGR